MDPDHPLMLLKPWAIYRKKKGQWKIIRNKQGKPVTYQHYGNALGVFILARLSHSDHCIAPA